MDKPSIQLSPEITRRDAFAMIDWLRDDEVTRYLADSRSVSRDIEQVVNRVNLPTLTHLFSHGGRFFMVCDERNVPVGFVRLVRSGVDYEMVIVIGDRQNWGRKLGTSTILLSVQTAFLELRAERLTARIHPQNVWSLRAFRNCGFRIESDTGQMMTFSLTRDQFLELPRNMRPTTQDIHMSRVDRNRLRKLIAAARKRDGADERALNSLALEIERAKVLAPRELSSDVITMNSRARLRLDDEPMEVTLVYPRKADGSRKLSVFSEVGIAVLGYREGDLVHWPGSGGDIRIQIEQVLYQPEAAGDFHL